MFDIIGRTLIALLAVIGLVESCRMVYYWLLRAPHPGRLYWIIPVEGHDEQAELRLRNALEHLNTVGGVQNKWILCVDYGMDEETRQICEIMRSQNMCILICQPEEVAELVE